MEDLAGAIEPHPKGLTIRFEVSPGSGRLEVPSGYNPWRKSIEARLTEEPTKGKANRQLLKAVAKIMGIPEGNVEVITGHKNSRKVLLVRGVALDQAALKLSEASKR
jgi:uncharacterized protein